MLCVSDCMALQMRNHRILVIKIVARNIWQMRRFWDWTPHREVHQKMTTTAVSLLFILSMLQVCSAWLEGKLSTQMHRRHQSKLQAARDRADLLEYIQQYGSMVCAAILLNTHIVLFGEALGPGGLHRHGGLGGDHGACGAAHCAAGAVAAKELNTEEDEQ